MIEINLKPTRSQLRSFALIWFPLMCCMIAYILWSRLGLEDAAKVMLGSGALVALVGGFAPQLIKWLFVGLMVVTFPIGFVVSNVVLVLFYFGIITPIGLLMRLIGRDPLLKGPGTKRSSYWLERPKRDDPKRYFRQF